MIRRLWRWLTLDVEGDALKKAATGLADAIAPMSDEQQARAYLNHPTLWWHAKMVAVTIDQQRGRR